MRGRGVLGKSGPVVIIAHFFHRFPSPYFKQKRSPALSHICLGWSPRGPCGSLSTSRLTCLETRLVEAAHSCLGAALLPCHRPVLRHWRKVRSSTQGPVPTLLPHAASSAVPLPCSVFEDCDFHQLEDQTPRPARCAQGWAWREDRSHPSSSRLVAMMTFQETQCGCRNSMLFLPPLPRRLGALGAHVRVALAVYLLCSHTLL